MDLKSPGNVIALASAPVDSDGFEAAISLHRRVASLIASGKTRAAHDVSDGGLLVALAEMCIASGLGLDVNIDEATWKAAPLKPVPTTYVLEMAPADAKAAGFPLLGCVIEAPRLRLSAGSRDAIAWSVLELAEAWRSPLRGMG